MTIDFPTAVVDIDEPGLVVADRPPVTATTPTPRPVAWVLRHRRIAVPAIFVVFVLGFSGAWTGGALVLDGPGLSLYLHMILNHLASAHRIPSWFPDLWAGAPIWVVTPALPLFLLVPLAAAAGPDVAVKVGVLGLQVVGACGAFVLARALWRNVPAAIAAGVVFGLQPMIISLGVLAGSQPTIGVMAAAPWLVWSLRRGFRGDGPGYIAVAGLLGAFAIQMQSEYAFALVLLAACQLAVEVGRSRTGRSNQTVRRLLGRATTVGVVGLGASAYWLLPFAKLGKSFILSPPALVQGELLSGSAARVGRELGVYFGRAQALTGVVSVNRQGLLPLFFHMGWVCLALTLATIAILPRKDRDGTLTAILLSAALGIWLSTGAIPAASSGPAARGQWIPFVAAGLVVGVLVGTLVRPLRLGRAAWLAVLAVAAVLAAVPYLTPFVTLQNLVPLFSNIRFPRFYGVAPLGLALGATYPIVLVQEWAERHRARTAPTTLPAALASAVALAVVAAFLVDIWPYRTYYRVRPPASASAYKNLTASLSAARGTFRLAPTLIEPTAADALLGTDHNLAIGWPHFVASKQVWRLTAEPFLTPDRYRERAYALSATAYQVAEQTVDKGTAKEAVPSLDVTSNPLVLPMVRAYAQTVTVPTDELTPELAVALAQRNVGVVTGSPSASAALKATTVADVPSSQPCVDGSVAHLDPGLASEVGLACGMHTWLPTLFAGIDVLNVSPGVGAVFRSPAPRLQGVSVYLDRLPDRAEVALYEVSPDGHTLGAELARGQAVGVDEYGLVAFTFDPIADSAGKSYAFVVTCPGCAPDKVPRLVVGHSVDQPGDLLEGGTVHVDRSVGFAPIYDPVAASPASTTTVTPGQPGPGEWRVKVSGAKPALVVVAEAWFPGWQAHVDGRPAPVMEADGAFVGVPVDAGDHVITLTYHRPAAALGGRLITFTTLLTVALLALRRRRSDRRRLLPAAVVPRRRPPSRTGARPDPRRGRPPAPPRASPQPEPSAPAEPVPPSEPDWDAVIPKRPPPPAAPAAMVSETAEDAPTAAFAPWPAPVGERAAPSAGDDRDDRDDRDDQDHGHEAEPPHRRRPGTAQWPPEPG